MQNSENFSAPIKATSGRSAYSPALYQIQSEIAKLLVSFRCQVKILEGQAGETAWCCGCSRHNRSLPIARRQYDSRPRIAFKDACDFRPAKLNYLSRTAAIFDDQRKIL